MGGGLRGRNAAGTDRVRPIGAAAGSTAPSPATQRVRSMPAFFVPPAAAPLPERRADASPAVAAADTMSARGGSRRPLPGPPFPTSLPTTAMRFARPPLAARLLTLCAAVLAPLALSGCGGAVDDGPTQIDQSDLDAQREAMEGYGGGG